MIRPSRQTREPESVDVAVVGGGVLGCAVAARLSTTTARVCLFEATNDVAEGATKGNAGIAVSYYGPPGTLEADLIAASVPGWEELCRRLDVPYRRVGGVMVAIDEAEESTLREVEIEARACGARAKLLNASKARALEPLITPACRAAVHFPDEGIIDPMRLAIAYARLSAANGCSVRRSSPVTELRRIDDRRFHIVTGTGAVRARFVVNAAGTASGEISRLAGGEPLDVWPRKGQYAVLDRELARRLSVIVFSTHQPETKGVNVVPTTHGTCLVGPTAEDHANPLDRATDAETVEGVLTRGRRLVPAIADAAPIKVFAANRPAGAEPVRLRFDSQVENLLHAANRSTGVSTSPAVAERALDLLRDAGLDAADRSDAVVELPRVPQLRTTEHPPQLLDIDPRYGQVVCACEHVSAAEVAAALAGPVGARSIDGIRKRTGATYGRCQGAMCMAGLAFLCGMECGAGPGDVPLTAAGRIGA